MVLSLGFIEEKPYSVGLVDEHFQLASKYNYCRFKLLKNWEYK